MDRVIYKSKVNSCNSLGFQLQYNNAAEVEHAFYLRTYVPNQW